MALFQMTQRSSLLGAGLELPAQTGHKVQSRGLFAQATAAGTLCTDLGTTTFSTGEDSTPQGVGLGNVWGRSWLSQLPGRCCRYLAGSNQGGCCCNAEDSPPPAIQTLI